MPVGRGFDIPQDVRDQVDFHWFHVGQTGSLMLACLSPEPIWYVGHFAGGRMVRCGGDGCKWCAEGFGKQLRYVVCCVELGSRTVGVLEVGKPVALALRDRALREGTCRGLVFELARAAKSKHARVEATFLNEMPPTWVAGLAPLDLVEVLDKTWSRQESAMRHGKGVGDRVRSQS